MLLFAVTALSGAAAAMPDELLIRKCTTCHTATRWETSRHTWPGWWWLTARMRWVNGASLDWSEHWQVTARLAVRYPAQGETARDEWLMLALVGLATTGLPAWWIVGRRSAHAKKRRQREA